MIGAGASALRYRCWRRDGERPDPIRVLDQSAGALAIPRRSGHRHPVGLPGSRARPTPTGRGLRREAFAPPAGPHPRRLDGAAVASTTSTATPGGRGADEGRWACAYRFSIAWPRVFPDGRARSVEGPRLCRPPGRRPARQRHREPHATFLPLGPRRRRCRRRGGWESRDTAEAFGAYAAHVVRRLGDRVRRFFPLNEIRAFIEEGYANGIFAPAFKAADRLNQSAPSRRAGARMAWRPGGARQRRAGTTVGPPRTSSPPSVGRPTTNVRAAGSRRASSMPYLPDGHDGRP